MSATTGASKESIPGRILREIRPAAGMAKVRQAAPTIIDEVADFFRRFVFFRDDVIYDLVAAWVVTTYLKDLFDYSGYLFAHSPEPQSGKSRLLEILDLLVKDSSTVLVSPTEAVLFRTANLTQLLDEVDSWANKDALKSVLNAGFRSGGSVTRIEETKDGFKPVRFPVYGPRALAGIGTRILDVTTRDRTFSVAMVRQMKHERREQLRMRIVSPEAEELKGRIVKWADTNREFIANRYAGEFPYLENFRDRTIDIAQPVATVVEVAYAGSPEIDKLRDRFLRAITITRAEDHIPRDQHKVVEQILQSTDEDPIVGSASELAAMCANQVDPPTDQTIPSVLRAYEFRTKSIRKDGGEPRYRYELARAKLEEILNRYGTREQAEAPKEHPQNVRVESPAEPDA